MLKFTIFFSEILISPEVYTHFPGLICVTVAAAANHNKYHHTTAKRMIKMIMKIKLIASSLSPPLPKLLQLSPVLLLLPVKAWTQRGKNLLHNKQRLFLRQR